MFLRMLHCAIPIYSQTFTFFIFTCVFFLFFLLFFSLCSHTSSFHPFSPNFQYMCSPCVFIAVLWWEMSLFCLYHILHCCDGRHDGCGCRVLHTCSNSILIVGICFLLCMYGVYSVCRSIGSILTEWKSTTSLPSSHLLSTWFGASLPSDGNIVFFTCLFCMKTIQFSWTCVGLYLGKGRM